MAFKLNNLVERVRSKMSGIPQTLNQIGQNLTDDEGLYQRGRFTPLQAIPQVKQANQAITNNVIKPMAQNTYNTAKPILNYLDPRGYQAERQDKTVGINSLGTQKLIGAAKAMPATAANLYGYSKLTPLTVGLSGAFGGVVNKATGGSFQQGFQQGVGVSPTIAGIGAITNPFISSVAGKAALPFNNPFAKQAVSRIATGIGNIPEGIAMSQGMGQAYSPGQAAFDFASGATFGSQAPNAKVKVKGAFGRRPNNIHPEDINAMDYAIDMFRLGKTPEEKKQAKQILYTLADRYLGTKERPESGDIKVIIKKLQNKANSSDVGMEGFQMGFTNTNKYKTGIENAIQKANSAEEGAAIIKNEADKIINTAKNENDLKALRASLNRYVNEQVGTSGNWKRDYYVKNAEVFGNPDNLHLNEAVNQIDRIDDILAKGFKKQPTPKVQPQNFTPINPDQMRAKQKLPGVMLTTSKAKAEGPKMKVKVKPERLPWETPADILKEKKLSNFDRMMEEADNSSGFKTVQQIEEDLPKTARAVSKKVNILDYLRTPDRVLEKIGLKAESDNLKQSYNKYLDELPKEIDKVTSWYERVKNNPGAEQRIFKYLDGQSQKLDGEELKVAKEMQNYLEQWADKLGLPQDKRIASYITHIFDKDFIEKEFDEDLAKIISEKIPGSVYDPFLQKRLGKMGYKEDVFQSLDAYVKRATRKYNMDPALEKIQRREGDLDLDSWKYVKSLTDRVNMRPTDLDNLLDNFIKSTPVGYRATARPTAYLTRGFRQMVYRATLGLNVGSALRNLSQGANTYAKLGEKYTGVGYMKALRNILSGDDELKRVGVLRDNMIQDRTLSSTKKVWEQFDRGLWSMFDMAEKINRGAAYFGAKSRALAKGKSEKQAIEEGIKMARDTQFTFGSVDTPAALQGDIMKSALQFQSYNVKQAEFLAEMAKNKDLAGMARYIGANLAIIYSFGKLIGMEPTDMIPFFNQIQEAIDPNNEGGKTPPSPAQTILSGVTSVPGVFSGDETTKSNSLKRIGKAAALVVPGGTQIRKSVGGVADSIRGYNPSTSGRVRFAVNNDPLSATRNVLFGSYNNENARDYFNNKRSVLGEKQSAYVANSSNPQAEIARIRQIQDQEKKLGIKPAGGTGNTAIDLSRRELKISNNGGLITDTKKQEQNNGIFSFFGGKKTEASETPKAAVDEYIQAYELDKYMGKAPTDPLKKITYEKNRLSKAKSIYNDDGTKYPDDIKKALIEKMGYNTDDIRYDVAANLSTAERASYMVERMKSMDEKQALQFLEDTRTKSLSDKIMGTKSVYDLLIENGYMDKSTRDYLLSFEKQIDSKSRKYTKKSTKKGKKLTKLTLPKVSPIKLTPIKLSNIKMPKSVSTKTKLTLPNKSRTMRIKV